jgi:hypothetical protein
VALPNYLQLNTRAREADRIQRTIYRRCVRAMYKWYQFVWIDEVSKVWHLWYSILTQHPCGCWCPPSCTQYNCT